MHHASATGSPLWDLVVVGAGPAGASTALGALNADPSLRVLLLDREDFPRDKACGDGIAPHVFEALAGVGVSGIEDGWEPIDRLDLRHGGYAASGRMQRPARVMPRTVLDARLVRSATGAGAVLRRHRVRDLDVGEHAVVLDGQIHARVVVGADGASSVVRTALGLPPSRHRAVAIRGYAPTPPQWRGRQTIVFGERRHPSYAWAFDRGDGFSNVGYGELVTGDRPTRASMLAELEALLPGATGTTTGWRAHLLPLSGRRAQRSGGCVLLVGDAAHLVNPLTGEGIFYAVSTGIAAGRATSRALQRGRPDEAGAHLDRAVRRLLSRHLRHTWTAAGLNRSTAVLDAGLLAASRDQQAFDALVELGLGRGLITPRLARGLAGGLRARLGTPPTAPPTAPSRTEATR